MCLHYKNKFELFAASFLSGLVKNWNMCIIILSATKQKYDLKETDFWTWLGQFGTLFNSEICGKALPYFENFLLALFTIFSIQNFIGQKIYKNLIWYDFSTQTCYLWYSVFFFLYQLHFNERFQFWVFWGRGTFSP